MWPTRTPPSLHKTPNTTIEKCIWTPLMFHKSSIVHPTRLTLTWPIFFQILRYAHIHDSLVNNKPCTQTYIQTDIPQYEWVYMCEWTYVLFLILEKYVIGHIHACRWTKFYVRTHLSTEVHANIFYLCLCEVAAHITKHLSQCRYEVLPSRSCYFTHLRDL